MSAPRFEVYPRKVTVGGVSAAATESGEYGWRLRAANGQIVAVGGEGFTREEDAERACTTAAETVAAIEWVGPAGSAVCVERVDG